MSFDTQTLPSRKSQETRQVSGLMLPDGRRTARLPLVTGVKCVVTAHCWNLAAPVDMGLLGGVKTT